MESQKDIQRAKMTYRESKKYIQISKKKNKTYEEPKKTK